VGSVWNLVSTGRFYLQTARLPKARLVGSGGQGKSAGDHSTEDGGWGGVGGSPEPGVDFGCSPTMPPAYLFLKDYAVSFFFFY
jgi:hypothetical protein